MQELYQALHKKQTEAASSQPSGDLQAPGNSGAEVNEIASQLAGQVIQGAITQWNSSDDSSKIMNQFRTATGAIHC